MNKSGMNTAYRENILQYIEEVPYKRVDLKFSSSPTAQKAKAVKVLRRNVRNMNLKDAKAVIRGKYTLKGITAETAGKIIFALKKYGVDAKITKVKSHANLPLDELNLSNRTLMSLKRAGINNLENLLPYYPMLKSLMIIKVRNLSLDEMNLSVRTFNCLKRAGVNNLGDLLQNYPTLGSLMEIRFLGRKSLEELIQKLNLHGISYPIMASLMASPEM